VSRTVRGLVIDAVLALAALAVAGVPLSRETIENAYANGVFAWLNVRLVPVTNALPFALGDVLLAAVVLGLIGGWIRGVRGAGGRWPAAVARLAAHTLALLAVVAIVFELAWGLNYRRSPVIARVAYDPARVTPANVRALSERIVRILNTDVRAAHARARAATPAQERAELARDFAPVAARLGDRWPVAVTVPKYSLGNRLYEMAGVGGQYDPFAFETILNASFLPYEIPRALAHEWSHVAGFGDEGDANFIGTVTCLRSSDPLIRYSGAFWTYAELPESERARLRLDPAVIADLEASRARFLRYYQPRIFDLSWLVYDRYLRANGVAGGVTSYSRFVALLVGTPFDGDGLPAVVAKP
jgi:hypothetical protein